MVKTAKMHMGAYISGAGHLALFLWLLISGFFNAHEQPPEIGVTTVTTISTQELAMLQQPFQETSVKPEPAPISEPSPEPVQTPEPAPEPEPAPVPDEPETGPTAAPERAPEPVITPEAAPVVSDRQADKPDPEVKIDDTQQAQTAPAPDAEQVTEDTQETAPQEMTPEIATEADKPQAPDVSKRPASRPNRPKSEPVQTVEPKEDPKPAEQQQIDPIAEALRQANETPARPLGPPLSRGERDGFRLGIQKCWNVGALGSDALKVVVTVGFSLTPDGKVQGSSVRMLSSSGGSGRAVERAYGAARSAIIRCGAKGYDLPTDKYEQWRDVEVTFDATSKRIK